MEFSNNDTFFEQIVPVRKDGKAILLVSAVWAAAALVLFLLFTVFFSALSLAIAFGALYGAWWLSSKLNVEYEYIITNGTMDIDKIINKSSRKRILSFELSSVTRLEKFNPAVLNQLNKKEVVIACTPDESNTYFLAAEKNGKGAVNLVFTPNAKIQSAVEKFAPKFITNNAFKK